MRDTDRADFSRLLGDVMGFYGQAITPFAMSVWWQACEGFELSQVAKAMTAHAMDPDRGQFAPKPADIVRQLHGTHADRSLIAWGKVLDAMQRVGAYQSVAFDDGAIHSAIEDMGGWVKVCRSEIDELPFVQKRFCDAHRAYSLRPDARHPRMLAGEHDTTNHARGHRTGQPVLIGDAGKAQAVMATGIAGPKTAITPMRPLLEAVGK